MPSGACCANELLPANTSKSSHTLITVPLSPRAQLCAGLERPSMVANLTFAKFLDHRICAFFFGIIALTLGAICSGRERDIRHWITRPVAYRYGPKDHFFMLCTFFSTRCRWSAFEFDQIHTCRSRLTLDTNLCQALS